MSDRLNIQKDKRKTKRYKRNSRFIIFLLLVCVASFGTLSGMLYAEYEETETWSGSELDQPLAHIPPEFAQNTYDLGILDDISILSQTTDILALIDEQAGLTDESIRVAEDVAETTENLLAKNNIESGNSFRNLERLQLYIDIYHIEQTIYDTLDTDELTRVMTQLQQHVVHGERDVDTAALERLQDIVTALNGLNAFIDTYHTQLGEVVDTTLVVPETMTREMTQTLLTTIEEQALDKFSVIQTLTRVLESSTWDRILANNQVLRDIDQWDKEWAVYNTLNKDQYRRIGSYPTLSDVQGVPWINIQGVSERPYQTVLGHSLVSRLTVNGETISHGQYVRKGLTVQAHIEPVYRSTSLPDARNIPDFNARTDYQSLARALTELLEAREARLEQERLEREREEREREEREREEREREEREREERERIEREQDEHERLERERLEREREDQNDDDATDNSESSDN